MAGQAIIEVQRKIRRALQSPLNAQALAASPSVPIKWTGIPFDRDAMSNYIDVQIGFGAVIVHEIGPNPLVEGTGFVTMVLHSPIDRGEDGNDKLLGIATAAYPLYSTPAFEGISVFVDKMQHRGYGSDGPWLTGLVSVDWNIYRRS